MNDIIVQLGFNVQNFNYDNTTELLYISGPALEEGIWHDSLGNILFYPTNVIQDAAPLFKDCDIVCEHRGKSIGKVTGVALNDNGFSIDACITNKASINAIINKDKLGFSIKSSVSRDPVTHTVDKIHGIIHIALVENPACKVCGITSAYTNEGIVIMSAKKAKIDADVVTEDASVDVNETDVVTADVSNDEPTVITEEIKTDPPASVPSANNVTIQTESVVIEQPFSEVMAALSAATSTVESVSTQLSVAITNFKEMENKCSNLEVQLSAKESEISSIKTEAESYKTKFEALQKQLDVQAQYERERLVTDIKMLDPEINDNIIDSMSTVQLSAYKGSLDRFSVKGMIGGERKGFKIDEPSPVDVETPVALSGVPELKEPTREEIAQLIFASLRKQGSISTRK